MHLHGRAVTTSYSFRGRLGEDRIQFCGPFGRVKAQIARGRFTPELLDGFKALERPGFEQRLRGVWHMVIDTKRRRSLILRSSTYRVELLFAAPIPMKLEQALRDVFCRRREVGTYDRLQVEKGKAMNRASVAKSAETTARHRAEGRPNYHASPSTHVRHYERLKTEDPEAWEALKAGKPLPRRATGQAAKE